MRVKLFTFRYSSTLGGFDESALTEFVRDKELLAFREHFFTVNEVPHLVCVLTWQDAVVGEEELALARDLRTAPRSDPAREPIPSPRVERKRRRNAPDPTEGMGEGQRLLFNALRDWRSTKAREEGVPPYLIFTNRHFVEMVTVRPDSPTALANLKGIGPGKVKRYAQEVLTVLNEKDTPAPKPEETPA